MREAPWSAAAKLPPWDANLKAVAGATALQGAFGATIIECEKLRRAVILSIDSRAAVNAQDDSEWAWPEGAFLRFGSFRFEDGYCILFASPGEL
jgi:hypothetical protein